MSSINTEGIITSPPGVFLGLSILLDFDPWGIFGLGSISTLWTTSSLYGLNCFKYFLKYILRQDVTKSGKKNFKMYLVFVRQNVPILSNCIH